MCQVNCIHKNQYSKALKALRETQRSAFRPSSNSQGVFRPAAAGAAAKSLQSCPTLCDPIDGSPPGSPIPGILQARTLEWVAIRKEITNKDLFYRTGNSTQYSVMTYMGKESKDFKSGHMYVYN